MGGRGWIILRRDYKILKVYVHFDSKKEGLPEK
jgi:hypothetical protein